MSFWDEIEVGARSVMGAHRFEADDIRRFAAKYDPQPFHLDEEAAKRSILGGLCASGWHTAAVCMRLMVDHRTRAARRWIEAGNPEPRLGPSPGIRNLRWPRPVRAGDTITYVQTVTAKRLSASRPGWGIAETTMEGFNESGELVCAFEGSGFFGTD